MPALVRQPDEDDDTATTSRRSSRPKPVSDVLNERVAVMSAEASDNSPLASPQHCTEGRADAILSVPLGKLGR
jgi:hypothetical protein